MNPKKPCCTPPFAEYAKDSAIEVIALATTDGFPVFTLNQASHPIEQDSLSAAASTLHSVSNAVAQQILGKRFRVTFIEAQQGNVAFVDLDIGSDNYVLVMSATQSMNIANLRLRRGGLHHRHAAGLRGLGRRPGIGRRW